MAEDTATLVETAKRPLTALMARFEGGIPEAFAALDTLAQRVADATENEAHAVQAFKAQEARAERAEAALLAHHTQLAEAYRIDPCLICGLDYPKPAVRDRRHPHRGA